MTTSRFAAFLSLLHLWIETLQKTITTTGLSSFKLLFLLLCLSPSNSLNSLKPLAFFGSKIDFVFCSLETREIWYDKNYTSPRRGLLNFGLIRKVPIVPKSEYLSLKDLKVQIYEPSIASLENGSRSNKSKLRTPTEQKI